VTEVKRTLPDFDQPPVIEVVLGVQFTPIDHFSLPHFGLFWTKVRKDYPEFVTQPPLPPVIEGFEPGNPASLTTFQIGLEVNPEPDVRGWYIDSTKTRLMQVQKDRFIYNWRKVQFNEIYPHYENIEPKFKEEWKRFSAFLQEEKLNLPEITQSEVTYVNHLEIGKGWKSFGDLKNVLACWSGKTSEPFLPEPERVFLKAQYVIEEKKGRLHISVQPAIRRADGKEILKLELTARGKPPSSKLEDILGWFELGHTWIVKGFTSFTTKQMHQTWERKVL
jgi:uncharacterized protein (TIGR04255 family)